MSRSCCGPWLWVVANAVLWFGGGAATVHLATRTPESELRSAQRERIEEALSELDLDAAQERELEASLRRFEAGVDAAWTEYLARIQELELATDQEIRGMLTEEQRGRVPGAAD